MAKVLNVFRTIFVVVQSTNVVNPRNKPYLVSLLYVSIVKPKTNR